MFIEFSVERGDHHFGDFGGPDPLFWMLLYKTSHINSHSPGGGMSLSTWRRGAIKLKGKD